MKKKEKVWMEGEHMISEGSKLENKTCGYVRENYKGIKLIHVHYQISRNPDRVNPPDTYILKPGTYVHFIAPIETAKQFLKDSLNNN